MAHNIYSCIGTPHQYKWIYKVSDNWCPSISRTHIAQTQRPEMAMHTGGGTSRGISRLSGGCTRVGESLMNPFLSRGSGMSVLFACSPLGAESRPIRMRLTSCCRREASWEARASLVEKKGVRIHLVFSKHSPTH